MLAQDRVRGALRDRIVQGLKERHLQHDDGIKALVLACTVSVWAREWQARPGRGNLAVISGRGMILSAPSSAQGAGNEAPRAEDARHMAPVGVVPDVLGGLGGEPHPLNGEREGLTPCAEDSMRTYAGK